MKIALLMAMIPGLKCLSAFGFWGTLYLSTNCSGSGGVSNAFRLLGSGELRPSFRNSPRYNPVSNAFRLLGSGEQNLAKIKATWPEMSQMPFGFWVLGNPKNAANTTNPNKMSLKCLSAFGFWGTPQGHRDHAPARRQSQMPFGFWVLGNRAQAALGRV